MANKRPYRVEHYQEYFKWLSESLEANRDHNKIDLLFRYGMAMAGSIVNTDSVRWTPSEKVMRIKALYDAQQRIYDSLVESRHIEWRFGPVDDDIN